jgi:hypothetical protein
MAYFSNTKKCAFLLLVLLQACATISDNKQAGSNLTFKYIPAVDIDEVRLQHPIQITEDEVRKYLQSFWYEETSLQRKKGRVFSEPEVAKISPSLTKALNQAKPDKLVQFKLATSKSDATIVEVFADKDKIHWRFQSIKGADFFCGPADCERINWRIIPKGGQRYFPAQTHLLGRVSAENWIIVERNSSK